MIKLGTILLAVVTTTIGGHRFEISGLRPPDAYLRAVSNFLNKSCRGASRVIEPTQLVCDEKSCLIMFRCKKENTSI